MNSSELILYSDSEIMREIGRRIKLRRFEMQLSIEEVAEQCGVGRRTVSNLEKGLTKSNLLLFIQVMRVLNLTSELVELVPEPLESPYQLKKKKTSIDEQKRVVRPRPNTRKNNTESFFD